MKLAWALLLALLFNLRSCFEFWSLWSHFPTKFVVFWIKKGTALSRFYRHTTTTRPVAHYCQSLLPNKWNGERIAPKVQRCSIFAFPLLVALQSLRLLFLLYSLYTRRTSRLTQCYTHHCRGKFLWDCNPRMLFQQPSKMVEDSIIFLHISLHKQKWHQTKM